MKNRQKHAGTIRTVLSAVVLLAVAGAILLALLNRQVVDTGGRWIVSEDEASKLGGVDCILVLGAAVYANKYPSEMLEDRLAEGVRLYHLGVSDRLLMSGDNGKVSYNEVKVMKDYAVRYGVPSSHIFQDHAGFSTYESMYRARDVFVAKKIVIVTQRYHLYRAVYIARALGLDAYGVASDPRPYAGQALREMREILARPKDVFNCIFKPRPTYLGDVIPVGGNGDITD
ncbi:protein SanA, affects membrane permeability for vancomycin [Sporobacter termitidis DSM 10068]|uniref:Protein SanA, affects membrane permeability for vancomycin n=1 Tax=Sporobacter termitidis DSM 10068 TaxID=1123282 RepID=A0A1M5YXW1_9FIRM|nr:ElyC/SanA/YdcF family protein [Sporobacter termitidis]SHI16678.1 protein SanA, affects membrane permeability for vancomycin [Sporobacter termitidis DSM 10068]